MNGPVNNKYSVKQRAQIYDLVRITYSSDVRRGVSYKKSTITNSVKFFIILLFFSLVYVNPVLANNGEEAKTSIFLTSSIFTFIIYFLVVILSLVIMYFLVSNRIDSVEKKVRKLEYEMKYYKSNLKDTVDYNKITDNKSFKNEKSDFLGYQSKENQYKPSSTLNLEIQEEENRVNSYSSKSYDSYDVKRNKVESIDTVKHELDEFEMIRREGSRIDTSKLVEDYNSNLNSFNSMYKVTRFGVINYREVREDSCIEKQFAEDQFGELIAISIGKASNGHTELMAVLPRIGVAINDATYDQGGLSDIFIFNRYTPGSSYNRYKVVKAALLGRDYNGNWTKCKKGEISLM